MGEPKRPTAIRTEQWEWTAFMDGHRATATSEQGAKYGALCSAYDALEARIAELERRLNDSESAHNRRSKKVGQQQRANKRLRKDRDEWKRRAEAAEQVRKETSLRMLRQSRTVHDLRAKLARAVEHITDVCEGWLLDASQGDGIAEEYGDRYDRARAFVAALQDAPQSHKLPTDEQQLCPDCDKLARAVEALIEIKDLTGPKYLPANFGPAERGYLRSVVTETVDIALQSENPNSTHRGNGTDPVPQDAPHPEQGETWIPWTGGEQPVPDDTTVEVATLGWPYDPLRGLAWEFDWSNDVEREAHIIKYRVIEIASGTGGEDE